MAPSIMSATSPVVRKRKGRADSPRSSNDTSSVSVPPVKTIQTTNGSNGTNGNGVSALKESNVAKEIPTEPALDVKLDVFMKTELAHAEIRKFPCVKHVRPAQFPEAIGALPFPQELKDLVAWTDVFVERLGWAALQAEKKTSSTEVSLARAKQENEKLKLEIQDYRTKLHNSTTDNHKLKGDISRLTSRNRFLENQHKCDVKQIEAFNKTIAEKQTAIWGLTKENEKQRASVHSLVDRVKQLIAANNDNKHLIDALKEWKAADKIHDDKIDKLVDSLKQDVETQKAATKAAEDKAEIANGKFKDLEHENARLVTLEAQLAERVKSIAEQLRQLEGDFGVTQGQKATLEASLAELTKKEADAHIEIQSLHQKVHDAKEEVKNAMKKVLESKDHAKLHWNILETIRVDGGWLRTNERHDCDELPVSQPITDINNPFN